MIHETEHLGETSGLPAAAPANDPDATVATIMTPGVVTIDMDAPLHQVQRIFQREGFHHLLVIEEGELVGVISDRDLLSAISPYVNTPSEQRRDQQTLRRRAHQIMSRRLVTVLPSTAITEAAGLLLKHKVGCLPVVAPADPAPLNDDSRLRLVTAGRRIEGIVTWRDVLAYYLGRET